jgi:hypothetical protein
MEDNSTKKNDRIGIITSLGIHALLLLFFLLIVAWQYPDPPPPSSAGAEIALGFEDEGKQQEEIIPQEATPVVEEEVEEIINNTESPEIVEEKKEEVKKEVKEKVIEKPKEEVPKKENIFQRKTNGTSEKEGNQGDPRSLYNKNNGKGNSQEGTGNGTLGNETTMNIDGWEFDNLSNKVDPTSKIGFINFKFVIDEDGKIISITKIAGANLSPTEESFYKKQLLETTFIWKDENTDPPARTTGYFTRTIRSQ